MIRILRVLLLTLITGAPLAHATNAPFPASLTVLADGSKGALLGPGWVHSSPIKSKVPPGMVSIAPSGGLTNGYAGSINGPDGSSWHVYPTNVRGIGFALGAKATVNGSAHWAGFESTDVDGNGMSGIRIPVKAGDHVEIQFYGAFVRVGDISKGDYSVNDDGIFMLLHVGYLNSSHKFSNTIGGFDDFGSNIRVIDQTCAVAQVPPVSLGDWASTTFKGVGTGSKLVKFNVPMTCPAGFNHIYYQLNPVGGSTVVNGQKGTISLSQGRVSGVGVQIAYNSTDTPVQFGKNVQVAQYDPKNKNQSIQLDFYARYIQIDSSVKGAGQADAQAVLTMSYD
ncbi:fimbrial protein [Burkholderia ubonensis]|uniref:fimbrial protein n=1 Tax=Burkholderia ubonensis TaxID=101571 RepID=UPI000B24042E|nr:fimbrial protein [Burkholderia ubonensis]